MRLQKYYYTYIITNIKNTVFYIGVTNNLAGRIWQHKRKINPDSFASRYNLDKLVYYIDFYNINEAIEHEKRLKRWHRQWKINLIMKDNPDFRDLSEDWFDREGRRS